MKNKMICRDLIKLDMVARDADDFFSQMFEELYEKGFVEDTFLNAIKEREKKFPTALPTQPYAVAIPHADPEHIKKQFIAIARLKNPIKWCEMATNDVWHDVIFVFMLGFKKEEGHVELLQVLVENFQDGTLMEKMLAATTPEEFEELVQSMRGM